MIDCIWIQVVEIFDRVDGVIRTRPVEGKLSTNPTRYSLGSGIRFDYGSTLQNSDDFDAMAAM